MGFEIFVDNLKLPKKTLNDQKTKFIVSDYQKSERDFAFIVDKKINAQDFVSVITNIDKNLISNINDLKLYSSRLNELEREMTLFHSKIVIDMSSKYHYQQLVSLKA